MQVQDVDPVGTQIGEALLDRLPELGSGDEVQALLAGAAFDDPFLGGDDDVVADALECRAHDRLGAVARRGVDHGDTPVDGRFDDGNRLIEAGAGALADLAAAAAPRQAMLTSRPVLPSVTRSTILASPSIWRSWLDTICTPCNEEAPIA